MDWVSQLHLDVDDFKQLLGEEVIEIDTYRYAKVHLPICEICSGKLAYFAVFGFAGDEPPDAHTGGPLTGDPNKK